MAGLHDCLMSGRVEEARARAALGVVIAEQLSLDAGSWLMANELVFEEDPPFPQFSKNEGGGSASSSLRLPRPVTCDPRCSEVAIARLRDVTDFQGRKRRMGKGGNDQKPELEKDGEPRRAKPGKGKEGKGDKKKEEP